MTVAQFVTRSTCVNCGSSDLRELSSSLFNEGALHGFSGPKKPTMLHRKDVTAPSKEGSR